MSATGVRGGITRSLEEGQVLIEAFKPQEASAIRSLILDVAREHGEVHADQIPCPGNVVGAQFNALARSGRLEKLNRHGQLEHRASAKPDSHGRRSYVWRLSPATQIGAGSGAPRPDGERRGAKADADLGGSMASPLAAGNGSVRRERHSSNDLGALIAGAARPAEVPSLASAGDPISLSAMEEATRRVKEGCRELDLAGRSYEAPSFETVVLVAEQIERGRGQQTMEAAA